MPDTCQSSQSFGFSGQHHPRVPTRPAVTVSHLLRQLNERRIALQLQGAQLRYSCPAGALSDDLRRLIYDHKPALAEILRQSATIATSAVDYPCQDELPKNPWLGWYLDTFDPRAHDWVITLLLRFTERVSLSTLQRAVDELISRHDAFRLRLFPQPEGGWGLRIAPAPQSTAITRHDVATVPATLRLDSIRSLATEQRRRLSIIDGPVLGVAICSLPDSEGDAVLLSVHHNIADGHSMSLLMRDLVSIYHAFLASESPCSRSSSLPYREYLLRLHTLTHSTDFLRDSLAFWLASDRLQRHMSLPHDLSNGRHTVSTSRSISTILDSGVMQQLARTAASRAVPLHELFVHALCNVMHQWTRSRFLHIDIEHHGRAVLGATDLTETVGPMTVKVPLMVDMQEVVGDFAKLSQELHDTVEHGLGYGFLRYCCAEPTVRARLAARTPARVFLNNRLNLGPYSTVAPIGPRNGIRIEGIGAVAPPDRDDLVSYEILLECDGSIHGARLLWTYSNAIHRSETIQLLANRFFDSLLAFA